MRFFVSTIRVVRAFPPLSRRETTEAKTCAQRAIHGGSRVIKRVFVTWTRDATRIASSKIDKHVSFSSDVRFPDNDLSRVPAAIRVKCGAPAISRCAARSRSKRPVREGRGGRWLGLSAARDLFARVTGPAERPMRPGGLGRARCMRSAPSVHRSTCAKDVAAQPAPTWARSSREGQEPENAGPRCR